MSFLKPRSTETTRDRLMTAAELAILEKGFAATSIEELIAEVGVSKGGFFYHFRDKSELVKAILARSLEAEERWFDSMFARAQAVTDDPLQEFLTFLRFLREDMERLPEVHPGCLITACCFQERLFEHDVHELAKESLLKWRWQFHTRLIRIAQMYPPKVDVDLEHLADMLTVLTDGGIILSKTVREKDVLPHQVELYRAFVRAVFLGTSPA